MSREDVFDKLNELFRDYFDDEDIVLKDEFIIASCRTEGNWHVRDELFLIDGTPVFDDLYRGVFIDDETLMRETPFGREYYRIKRR